MILSVIVKGTLSFIPMKLVPLKEIQSQPKLPGTVPTLATISPLLFVFDHTLFRSRPYDGKSVDRICGAAGGKSSRLSGGCDANLLGACHGPAKATLGRYVLRLSGIVTGISFRSPPAFPDSRAFDRVLLPLDRADLFVPSILFYQFSSVTESEQSWSPRAEADRSFSKGIKGCCPLLYRLAPFIDRVFLVSTHYLTCDLLGGSVKSMATSFATLSEIRCHAFDHLRVLYYHSLMLIIRQGESNSTHHTPGRDIVKSRASCAKGGTNSAAQHLHTVGR